MLVPLADMLNHSCESQVSLDLLEKNLHKSMNKIYLYKHKFGEKENGDGTDDDAGYDKHNSKIKIKCQKMFTEDEIAQLPGELRQNWEIQDRDDPKKLYSRPLCKERFLHNLEKHCGLEEQKHELDDEAFGKQLWGIGYISSDWQEDRDDEEIIYDDDELFEESELMTKI